MTSLHLAQESRSWLIPEPFSLSDRQVIVSVSVNEHVFISRQVVPFFWNESQYMSLYLCSFVFIAETVRLVIQDIGSAPAGWQSLFLLDWFTD